MTPYTMAIVGIVPEHAYDSATYGSNPIGSGRYILKQWDRGQQVILEANPDYYGEEPEMKQVTILFMEEDAAFLAAQAGEVDLAYTSATYSDQEIDGYDLAAYASVDWIWHTHLPHIRIRRLTDMILRHMQVWTTEDLTFRLWKRARTRKGAQWGMTLLPMCWSAVPSISALTGRR